MRRSILLVVLFVFSIFAETRIKDDLTGMNLDESGNPFIVEQDIIVPNGQKVVIKEGCIFLFNPFTGLQVLGELNVQGAQNKPVVFTSIYDNNYNQESPQLPNPFDWNGILVARESGTVNLTNFELQYSVYGIKSQNPGIKIKNGVFKQNGQFHFTIMDKIQFVQDNIPFTFNQHDVDPGTGNTETGKSDEKQGKKTSKNVKIFRYVSLGIGAAGLLTGVAFAAQMPRDWDDMETANKLDNQYRVAEKSFNKHVIGASIGGGFFVIGMACFGFSFTF